MESVERFLQRYDPTDPAYVMVFQNLSDPLARVFDELACIIYALRDVNGMSAEEAERRVFAAYLQLYAVFEGKFSEVADGIWERMKREADAS